MELTLADIIDGEFVSDYWFSMIKVKLTPPHALLFTALKAVDECLDNVAERMRDLHVPDFASELM
ncbi:hypothetical protein EON79_00160 [bacterium]|nr:MAG: hypothetical protein EON79_00160 [bacterium]